MTAEPTAGELAARLRAFAALEHLSDPQLETLAEGCRALALPAGATVLREGESTAEAYLVESGELRIRRDTPYGLYTLAELGAGDLFGEASFVDRGSRSGDAVAATDLALLGLLPDRLEPLLAADPKLHIALYWTFWRSLSTKLRATNQRLAHFFSTADPARPGPTDAAAASGSFRIDIARKRAVFREARLSPMEIHFLATLSKERRLGPKEVLFREGDAGDALYVVLDGRIMISKQIAEAGEEALAFLERGAFFGEMSLIDRQPRSADAAADEKGAVVLAIPHDVLQGILDIEKVSSLPLLKLLSNLVAKRLREIDDKLVGWYIFSGGSDTQG